MSGPDCALGEQCVAVGVQAAYDAVARAYHDEFGNELDGKPLDRALLEAFTELAGAGVVADVGCGPGHITRFLAARHAGVIGIDVSPGMIRVAREQAPALAFAVGLCCDSRLPTAPGPGPSPYSIIHLTASQRARAFREFARTVRPGGWLLVAFHVDSPEFAAGEVNHLTDWFGQPVELDGYLVHFTWHIVTVMLLAFSVLLMTLAWAGIADLKTLLLRWLAVFWLAATATIFWVARRRVRNLLCPPIPLLFVVIAVMCWAAST